MGKLLNVLDNNVHDTLVRANGKSLADLEILLEAERNGKTRKGVVNGLERMVALAEPDKVVEPDQVDQPVDGPEKVLGGDQLTATTGEAAKGNFGQSRTEFIQRRGFLYGR
jgi:hypothetical protein